MVSDRYELFAALKLLRRGYTLVHCSDSPHGCAVGGAFLYSCFPDLKKYRLIQPVDNPDGFEGIEYYRIAPAGVAFEARLQGWWRELSPWQRIGLRLFG
ncbi:MAG: hypothetical protein IH616_03415 [Gemmatimonadales bacterium]|nr:hypothetical protein [Gemmatimonadales bacterium]